MRLPRLFASIAAAVAIGILLAGCTVVSRIAARLNLDGTLDFASCEAQSANFIRVEWNHPEDSTAARIPGDVIPVVGEIEEGDVFHLESTAPMDEWESVSIETLGKLNSFGYFTAEELEGGDWVWNQTGIGIGTVDVEHCDLDEANIRNLAES